MSWELLKRSQKHLRALVQIVILREDAGHPCVHSQHQDGPDDEADAHNHLGATKIN